MKNFVFMVVLFMLCGCTVVYKMPDTPPAPTQTPISNPPQTVAPPPAPVQRPTPAPKVSTISESVQLCQDIQRASNITIGCEFKYIDGTPTMYLLFPDYTTASNSWQILTESLAAPFCIAANSANRQAQLVLYISNPKMAVFTFVRQIFGLNGLIMEIIKGVEAPITKSDDIHYPHLTHSNPLIL